MFEIPLNAYPNQEVSFIMNGQRWTLNLETRLNNLYASVSNESQGTIVLNRICLNRAFFTSNLVFIDTEGAEHPDYKGLGDSGRFKLVWFDEKKSS
ncbi:hypothetical protein RMB03_17365 [Acinetobacter sp. V91_7]|uniref:phage baseplate plug family protein n=1 Tax=unclassified Acinetobacter TaxID=196816 RepID=UPI00287DD02B|nr:MULTISPECIES: hypothetical protein [unclassified Acinetobacter]MDS7935674.1 hypothetical protein [Acinetobacter sp. V91_4B]MDS7964718.1 hypothetical protein [Acinetobacter sp. V91_7]MDS8025587.1 hypothetical protein [Acinetobacter sp. V91_13]